jgi:tetratricopeptide (TPR) repeat protein
MAEETDQSALLLGDLANLQFQQRDYQSAAESYQQILKVDPNDRTARLNLAICLEKTSRWAEAADEFAVVLKAQPNREEAQLGLGICYLHLKREREALEIFENALEERPNDQVALVGKSVALQILGRQREATEVFQTLSKQNPELSGLGQVSATGERRGPHTAGAAPGSESQEEQSAARALAAGDYRTAIRFCSRLVQMQPSHFEAWLNLGVARQKVGENEDAVFAYHQALRLRPNAYQPHLNLGILRQSLGDLSNAADSYQAVLRTSPRVEVALWNLALIRERDGKSDEAEQLYRLLLEVNPAMVDARFRLGYLLLQRDSFKDAAETFAGCLEKRRNWTEARINLAIANYRLNNLSEALSEFESIVAMDPRNAEAWLGIASIAMASNQWARVAEANLRLKQLDATSAELSFNLALHCEDAGNESEAEGLYRDALREQPVFPEALLNLGNLLERRGEMDEARFCWKRAVEFKPDLAPYCA